VRNVWDNYYDYNFFRPYIEWAFRTCYSKIEVNGLENLPSPKNASVIISANHCNTMMDSLLILQSRKEPVFFVARADIFKKKFFATILNRLKIMPIYRKRDCQDSCEKNVAVFDNVVDGLNGGIAFSIHPEGTHRTRRSLLQLRHGIFKIARQAALSNPGRPVYIVPTGLEYDDYFNIMRPVKITYGKPILITGSEDIESLSAELYDRMSSLITFFPDDEHLEKREKEFYESKKQKYNFPHWLLAATLLPVFLTSGILCSPIILISGILNARLKDKAWKNTVRYSCKLALTPFLVITAAIVGFIKLPWYLAIVLIFATLYAHPVFYWILSFYKRLIDK